ncbi:MAG: P-II family nitrogen regulator [Eubacteriales bacterium]|nr:P-II family nitrogen regulator [Eubacteriales bacterium]
MNQLSFVITITERENGERIKLFLEQKQASVVMSMPGLGTASDQTLNLLGLEATEKAVLFSLIPNCLKTELMHGLLYKLRIYTPGAGIAMSIPLESVGGNALMKAILNDPSPEGNEEKDMNDMPYSLVVVIANCGCTDQVMDAARSANATGGTVLHVKGTDALNAEKFFGLSLADEKELILIATEKAHRNEIMKSVMLKAGQKTEAHAICFSLPVDQIAGFRLTEELEAL